MIVQKLDGVELKLAEIGRRVDCQKSFPEPVINSHNGFATFLPVAFVV